MVNEIELRSEQIHQWLGQADQLIADLRRRLVVEEDAERRTAIKQHIEELADDIAYAERQWVQLVAQINDDPDAITMLYLQLAADHVKVGNFALGLISNDQAIQRSGHLLGTALLQRAEIYTEIGRWAEALDVYGRINLMMPLNRRILIGRAVAVFHLGNLGQAEKEFLQAQAIARSSGDDASQLLILRYLASIAILQGQLQRALQYYNEAIHLGETFTDKAALAQLYYHRAKLLEKQSNETAALESYERALEHAPNADIYQSLAFYHRNRYHLDSAERFQGKALELEPDRPDLLANMGAIQVQRRNYEEAYRLYKQSLDLGWNEAYVYDGMGACEMVRENFAAAANAFRQAIVQDDQNYRSWVNLGIAIFHQGEIQQAIVCYNRALELMRQIQNYQDEQVVLLNLDEACSQSGRSSRAIVFYHQALKARQELNKERPSEDIAQTEQVGAAVGLKEPPPALEHLHQTTDSDLTVRERQKEEVIQGNLATAYLKLGGPVGALTAYLQPIRYLPEMIQAETGPVHVLLDVGIQAFYL